MKYEILTTLTESKKSYRHQIVRKGKVTGYKDYSPIPKPPARLVRWLHNLNLGTRDEKQHR